MARRGLTEEQRQQASAQGAWRAIARGERPVFRLGQDHAGRWVLLWTPWIVLTSSDRRAALEEARRAVAFWLEVDPDTFDVEVEEPRA